MTNDNTVVEEKMTKKSAKINLPWWGWTLSIAGVIVVLLVTIGIVLALNYKKTVARFQNQATETVYLAREAYGLFQAQDLPATKAKLVEVKTSLAETESLYTGLKSPLTLLGHRNYYDDGLAAFAATDQGLVLVDKVVAIIEQNADLLGFTTEAKEEGGTAEDRIKKLLTTLQVIGPELDEMATELTSIQTLLHQIDPQEYPVTVGDVFGAKLVLTRLDRAELVNQEVRQPLIDILELVDLAVETFADYRPVIDKIPEIMGANGETKKYLILFQNNNELRPTGGFLTAYSIVTIADGKVTPEKSDDIYELDQKFQSRIAIPATLGKYLTTEKYWNLRDMNIDPDFAASMTTFLENYQEVKGEPQDIDGIIAIDTKVLTDLIDVLGPVSVPGYGDFSTELDNEYQAPQIVVALSEIITKPTPYIRADRKGILGPMMKAILEKVYSAQKEQFPQLFQLIIDDIAGRHVQAYFLDEEFQAAADKIDLSGKMIAAPSGEDFLAIVDANLGGAKSNLFIDYGVEQTILPPSDGVLEKQVVINYRNSRAGDNCDLEAGELCLNATNNDWNRIYLPLGAELISAKGYKGEPTVYEENGFTVIDGFFALSPNSTAKIDLQYTIPYQNEQEYVLNVWQQGGLRTVTHLIDVNGDQEEIIVDRDTVYRAPF